MSEAGGGRRTKPPAPPARVTRPTLMALRAERTVDVARG
jgi:hypothetical protein